MERIDYLPVEQRIIRCRKAISLWNRELHINRQKTIEVAKQKLEDSMSSSRPNEVLIQAINSEFKKSVQSGRRFLETEKQTIMADFGG